MTDQDFLWAILAEPDDDLPRLAYADWLDEQGQGERAEFVRVGCALAGYRCDKGRHYPPCRSRGPGPANGPHWRCEALRDREGELLCRDDGQCAHCDWHAPMGHSGAALQCAWEYRRGFVARVACTLADWQQHGPAIVACQPVEEVRLTDREPRYDRRYKMWDWWCLNHGTGEGLDSDDLPQFLFELLKNRQRGYGYETYSSVKAAHTDLSRACLAWARAQKE